MCVPPGAMTLVYRGREYVDTGLKASAGDRAGARVFSHTIDSVTGPQTSFHVREGPTRMAPLPDSALGPDLGPATSRAWQHRDRVRQGLDGDVKRYVKEPLGKIEKDLQQHDLSLRPDPRATPRFVRHVTITKIIDAFTRSTRPAIVDVETWDDVPGNLGNRVRNGRAVGTLSHGGVLNQAWFDEQSKYVAELHPLDLFTVAAYANRSHTWIGPYQRAGVAPRYGTRRYDHMVQEKNMVSPLFAQMYDILADMHPDDMGPYFERGRFDISKEANIEEVREKMTRFWATEEELEPGDWAEMHRSYQKMLAKGAFSEHALLEALARYEVNMTSIITNAPRSTSPMVLYRGTTVDPYETSGTTTRMPQFTSAALAAHTGIGYALTKETKGLLQRMTVMPHTPVLLMACINNWSPSGEYEVLLNKGTTVHTTDRAVERVAVNKGGNLRSMKVTNAIAE